MSKAVMPADAVHPLGAGMDPQALPVALEPRRRVGTPRAERCPARRAKCSM